MDILLPFLESIEAILEKHEGAKVRICVNACYNCKEVLPAPDKINPLIGRMNGRPIPLCKKCYPDFQIEEDD